MSDKSERIRVGTHVTIYPRGKSKMWIADFWHDGRHQRVSLKTRNKKVAVQKAVKLDGQLAAGTFKAAPPPTAIAQAVADYLEFLKVEGRARKTIVRYQGELQSFRDHLASLHATRLAQITPTLFDKFRAHCKKLHGERTLFHESVVVKQWVKWCHRRRLMAENPLADYKLKKPVIEPRDGPSLAQVDKILAAARRQRKIQYAVLAFTGMRSGECRLLRPEDVDLEQGWIKIVSRPGAETKTRRSRKIPIHRRLKAILMSVPKVKRPWFFTEPPSPQYPKGNHWINNKRLNEDFVKLLRKLQLPAGREEGGFTAHSLRNFFETICTDARIPERVVDAWQGHRPNRSMGGAYYKLSDTVSKAFMEEVPFGNGEPVADTGE